MSARIVITGFSGTTIEGDLDRSPFAVGRDASCNLVLEAAWISRRQLVFEEDDSGWSVRPEGRNEMRLERAPLTAKTRIKSGDRIEMGPALLLFVEHADTPALDETDFGAPSLELSIADVGRGATLGRLAGVSAELMSRSDPDEVARVAIAALRAAFASRSVALIEGAISRPQITAAAGRKLASISRTLIERAENTGGTLCLDDASAVAGDGASVMIAGIGPVIVSALGPPAQGVLYADRAVGQDPFSRDDAAFATVLAHLTGAALGAARRVAYLEAERSELRRDIDRRGRYGELIGSSAPMVKLAASIAKVAPTEATVLITGETGSGKELVAREVHRRSRRSEGPFFALNCAALPETLIESELFGHKRGAFSGADRDRRGIFESAQGGTVFLDEIGELPLAAQAKVLRALDAREVLPLGGGMPIKIDVRLLAATHRDLQKEVAAGRFRQDLLFRLKVFPLQLAPLRERKDDLPALVRHFFESSAEARRKRLRPATKAALQALSEYSFPGNVRELAHLIEQAAIMAEEDDALDVAHFSDEIFSVVLPPAPPKQEVERTVRSGAASDPIPYPPVASLKEMTGFAEREIILRELAKDGWNRTRAAKRLKISLRALMDKLKRYDIKEDP